MSAHTSFKQTIGRAQRLINLHHGLNPRGQPRKEYADILRSAVVIAVSAMDAYLHEKIPEKIAKLVRFKKGKALPGKLVETIKANIPHDRLIEIFFEERPLTHIVSVVRKSMEDRTYQNAGKIEDVLRMLGLDDLWFLIAKELRISKDEAKIFIQPFVERRHLIVHRGDLGTRKTKHKLKPMTRPYAQLCINRIEKFVEVIDALIERKVP